MKRVRLNEAQLRHLVRGMISESEIGGIVNTHSANDIVNAWRDFLQSAPATYGHIKNPTEQLHAVLGEFFRRNKDTIQTFRNNQPNVTIEGIVMNLLAPAAYRESELIMSDALSVAGDDGGAFDRILAYLNGILGRQERQTYY